MRKVVWVVLVFLVMGLVYSQSASTKTFEGYISDVLCGNKGVDASGNNLKMNPEKHAVSCLKMEPCVASGYGIFVKGKEGAYTFYKFDKAGSDLAYKEIIQKTKKTDDVLIEVTGELKDGVITVKSITEKQVAAAPTKFEGYISDVLCGTKGKDAMGDNLKMNPEKHPITCLKMQPCIASGYGMFIKAKDGTYTFYKFDKAGSDLAFKEIVKKTKKPDAVLVEVSGDLKDDVITVKSVTEK